MVNSLHLHFCLLVQSYGFVLRWYEDQHSQQHQQQQQQQQLRPGESRTSSSTPSSSSLFQGQQHQHQLDPASSSPTSLSSDSISAYDSKGRYLPTPWQGFVAGCTAGLMQVSVEGRRQSLCCGGGVMVAWALP
jgi:hypothetical protein